MITRFVRSLAFHICYFFWGAIFPLLISWAPFTSKKLAWDVALMHLKGQYFLERLVMGLDYDVKGIENLPKDGPYIAALKHQSVWETLKLPFLFEKPAIILKKELTHIPVWGWFLDKLDMIPVDRGTRNKAIASMLEGAKKIVDQGRPVVIFPQGTRVPPGEARKYRYGIVRLYKELNLPIVPVALNSGVFWGKNQFLKKSGRVTIEILPPIPPGLPEEEMQQKLQYIIETHSNILVKAAGGPEQLQLPAPYTKDTING